MSENTNTNMRKYPFSILIWAAFSRDFKSKLIFIDKSVNDERYKKMLIDSKIFKELDIEIGQWEYYFQQDGATCHWTPKVMSYINRKARVLNEWPPNSPYLSPIENLWAIMKSRLNRLTTKPKNKAKLKKTNTEVYDSIDMTAINNLVNAFESCMCTFSSFCSKKDEFDSKSIYSYKRTMSTNTNT